MIPFFKSMLSKLLYDKLAFARWTRALLITCAAGGIAFADQLASVVDAPGLVKGIKVVAVICGFVGGAITAGEKNE